MSRISRSLSNLVPIRAVIWVMLFTCTLFLYMLRTNISLILLAMVDPTNAGDNTSVVSLPECSMRDKNISTRHNDTLIAERHVAEPTSTHGATYQWDSKLQGLILGAYFWGFVLSNVPAGVIAEKFGPRRTVTISFALSAILTLFGPLCARIHPYMLIASRFLIGLFGGIVYPAVHCLISQWAPPTEKGKFISATLGSSLGTVLTWPLLGGVIEHIGWAWAFYISGIIVILWTIVWAFLVHDSPKDHPWITETESKFIVNSLAGTVSSEKRTPPYKSIMTSVPAWALCVAQFGNLWGLFFLMTAGPKFMSTVLGFDLGHTGFLAAIPYLARMAAGFVFGSFGDFLVRKQIMTKNHVRKVFIILSHILPGVLLIAQTFVGCEATWVIILITLSLAFNGASTITHLSNAQDLAPNFAGSLYGIANCLGSTSGFISPMIVGYITDERNGLNEWHTIFYIGAVVYIICGSVFMIFGTADIQSWNYSEDERRLNAAAQDGTDRDGVENAAFDKSAENKV